MVHRTEEGDDGGLVRGDAVKVAHWIYAGSKSLNFSALQMTRTRAFGNGYREHALFGSSLGRLSIEAEIGVLIKTAGHASIPHVPSLKQ